MPFEISTRLQRLIYRKREKRKVVSVKMGAIYVCLLLVFSVGWVNGQETTTSEGAISANDEGCGGEEVAFKVFESFTISQISLCQQLNREECLHIEEAQEQCPCICYNRKRYYNSHGVGRDRIVLPTPKYREPIDWDKEPKPADTSAGLICFSGDTMVKTNQGEMSIGSVYGRWQQGESFELDAFDKATGKVVRSQLKRWIHAEPKRLGSFRRFTTESGRELQISDMHVIYRAVGCNRSDVETVLARRIVEGDCLLTTDGNVDTVVSVDRSESMGVFAPLTDQATVIVEGLAASCYANHENEHLQNFAYGILSTIENLIPDWLLATSHDSPTTVSKVLLSIEKLQHYLFDVSI